MRKRIFHRSNILRFTKICVIIFSFLALINCDIVDAIADVINGDDDPNSTTQQEQALKTVITLQDQASNIMDNLINSGIDTLIVIDSLVNFFLSDTSIENVWPDSQGVAVEYKNGISGGIFVGRHIIDVEESALPDTFYISNSYRGNQKQMGRDVKFSPAIKKSIYFDGAYSELKDMNDNVIVAANNSFQQVDIEPFDIYFDHEATIAILSTLSDYGIIHLTGHGWFRKRSGSGLWTNKETYFLTGEIAEINNTFGNYWTDLLDKKIIVATYGKENRYWVSPKFVSERNSFQGNDVFIYNAFCDGYSGSWIEEMVTNAGASVLVGYFWRVNPKYEWHWAKRMYERMGDTTLDDPYKIDDCITDIIYEQGLLYRGWYSFRNSSGPSKFMHLKYSGDGDYSFWEKETQDFNRINLQYDLEVKWETDTNWWRNDWSGYWSPANLKLSKVGQSYSGTWEGRTSDPVFVHSGSIEFILKNDQNTDTGNGTFTNIATNLEYSVKWGPSWQLDTYNIYEITMTDVAYTQYQDGSITFAVNGEQTCNHITFMHQQSIEGNSKFIRQYQCTSDSDLSIDLIK